MTEQIKFDPRAWLTSNDAAELSGYTVTNIHRAARAGTLPHIEVEKARFFRESDVLEYARKMAEIGTAKHDRTSKHGVESTSGKLCVDRSDWLTVREAVDMSGYSISSIYKLHQRGKLPSVKRGKTVFLPRDAIMEYACRKQELDSE